MTALQIRLVNAYTTLVMANRIKIEEVPITEVALAADGTKSTIKQEVEVEIAKKTIEVLG